MKKRVIAFFCLIVLLANIIIPCYAYETEENMQDEKVVISNSEADIYGTDSFGMLLANEINEASKEKENTENDIFSVEMNNKDATVSFRTKQEAKITVAIYDESKVQLKAYGIKNVLPEENETVITIDITNMPEYYYLKAFMVDENNMPLTKAFESPMYTKDMQDLQKMTTNDFAEEKVLNLDENTDNNFAIYGDNVKIINAESNVNILQAIDEENKTYVFTQINEKINTLKNGDKISFVKTNGDVLLINISKITINGKTATIVGNDSETQDFFDYVKIDTTPTRDKYYSESIDDPDIIFEEDVYSQSPNNDIITYSDKENSFSYSASVEIAKKDLKSKNDYLNFEGSFSTKLGFSLSANLKTYITLSNQYIDFSFTPEFNGTVSISGKGKFELPIKKIKVKLLKNVEVDMSPKFAFEVSGNFEASIKQTATLYFNYNNGDISFGSRDVKTGLNPDMDADTKLTAFIGFTFSPEIELTEAFKASISAKAGVEFASKKVETSSSVKHDCNKCIGADINFLAEVSVTVEIFEIENEFKEKSSIKYSDFYYCFEHGTWGFTICPNIKYLVELKIKDPFGELIKNAEVFDKNSNPIQDITYKNGMPTFYLPSGKHKITVKKDSTEKTLEIEVEDFALKKEVKLFSTEGNVIGGTFEGTQVTWALNKEKGFLIIDGKGFMPEFNSNASNRPYAISTNDTIIKKLIIGKEIRGIGYFAFANLSKLEDVEILGKIKYIDNSAFYRCSSLKNINLPYGLTWIFASAFKGCTSLKSIVIPNSVTMIGGSTFEECRGLESIKLSNRLECLNRYTFLNCDSLKELTIPGSVKNVRGSAIHTCKSLKTITIEYGVETVNMFAIAYCPELTNVYYSKFTKLEMDWNYKCPKLILSNASTDNQISTSSTSIEPITETVDNLIPNQEYIVKVVNSIEKDGTYYTNYLQYITQEVADENGNISITYIPRENDAENLEILVYGIKELDKIELDETEIELQAGDTNIMIVALSPQNVANANINWKSSNEKVAKIDGNGNILAISNGTAIITASIGELKATCKVFVGERQDEKLPFTDIKENAFYSNALDYMYKNGYVTGTTKTTFSPNDKLSRAMLVTILWNMEGKPKTNGTNKFKDVKNGAWYTDAIVWASTSGVVNGNKDGTFTPNNNITRQEVAVMLCNYAKYKGKNVTSNKGLSTFKDSSKVASWALPSMRWAIENKVIGGAENGTKINPVNNATRAEAVTMIKNYIDNVK